MKKTKNFLGFLLAMSMMPVMNAVQAEETAVKAVYSDLPTGWTSTYVTRNTSWNKEYDGVGIAYGAGVDEKNALYVDIDSPYEADRYILLQVALTGTLEANTTYRVSLDCKPIDTTGQFTCKFDWNTVKPFSNFTKSGDAANGFSSYYIDITTGDTAPTGFDLGFNNKMAYVIDNLSVQKLVDGTPDGTELVSGGNMENVAYRFDVSDENYSLSKDWHLIYGGGTWNKEVDIAKPTKKYARTGKYALHIKNTNPNNENFRVKNCDYRYYNNDKEGNFRYTPGTYKLEYWAKLKQRDYICAPGTTGWAKAYANINEMATNTYDENGWRKYEKTIVLTQEDINGRGYGTTRINDYFAFAVTKGCEVIVDDVKLYKVGEESVNLVKDGGFEGSYLSMEEAEGNTFVYPIATDVRNWKTITAYCEPTAHEKYEGKYSVHLVAGDTNKADFRYLDIRFNNLNLKPGKYNISFYAKGRYGRGAIYNNAKNADGLKEFSAMTKGATDENGWIKYNVQTTYTTANASIVFTILYGTDMYIDNVEILAADDATKAVMGTGNLISYGNFETVSKVEEKGTEAVHPMAYTTNDGKGFNLSWTNPDNSYIEDIDVYVDGNLVKNNAHNLDKSAFNEMLVTGLTPNKDYNVDIVMNVDGTPVTNSFKGMPDAAGAEVSRGGWKYNRFTNAKNGNYANYANANFVLDSTEKVSGNNSLKMDINLPEIKANIYPSVTNSATVRKDTEYIFTMKYKTKNLKELPIIVEYIDYDENGNILHKSWKGVYVGPSSAWKTFTHNISGTECNMHEDCKFYDADDTTGKTYKLNIYVTAQQGTGTMWVDDVSLQESFGGTPFGDNLFANGGFEYTYEVQNPVLKSGDTVIKNVAPGKMDVTAKIKNYTVDGMNKAVVVALYKDGQLYDIATVEKPVNVTPLVIPAEEITQTVEAPEDITDGNYEVKVFYWDGLSVMTSQDTPDLFVEAN